MKQKLKNIWQKLRLPLVWLTVVSGFFLTIWIGIEFGNNSCTGLKVALKDHGQPFLTSEEVDELIRANLPNNLEGMEIELLDLSSLEQRLQENPFVEDARLYFSMNRKLRADVTLRQPEIRIINKSGVHYYLDRNGVVMPLSGNFTPRVLVANGYISPEQDTMIHRELIRLSQFLREDEFWNAMIDQVYVNREHELELIPKFGADVIKMGSLHTDLDTRFRNLKIFYHEGLKYVGWNLYKSINLSFEGQVVCTKKY